MSTILVPRALKELSPGSQRALETAFKSIKPAIDLAVSTVSTGASQTQVNGLITSLGTVTSALTALQNEVAVLQDATGTSTSPLVETFAMKTPFNVFPQAVYESSPNVVDIADKDTAFPPIGIATGPAPDGQVFVTTFGDIFDADWTFTPGLVYLGTAGALTQTQPTSGFATPIASAVSSTQIRFFILTPTTNIPAFASVIAAVPTVGIAQTQLASLQIPANTVVAGRTYRIDVRGVQSATPATVTVQIHVGTANTTADAVITTVDITVPASGGIQADALLTFRSIGPTGTCIAEIRGTPVALSITTATTTLDTTTLKYLTVSAAASAGTSTFHVIALQRL